jgi:hypothetical protein
MALLGMEILAVVVIAVLCAIITAIGRAHEAREFGSQLDNYWNAAFVLPVPVSRDVVYAGAPTAASWLDGIESRTDAFMALTYAS